MQVISPNNVKIYNLSAGKSLPDVKTFELDYIKASHAQERSRYLLLIQSKVFFFFYGLLNTKNF